MIFKYLTKPNHNFLEQSEIGTGRGDQELDRSPSSSLTRRSKQFAARLNARSDNRRNDPETVVHR